MTPAIRAIGNTTLRTCCCRGSWQTIHRLFAVVWRSILQAEIMPGLKGGHDRISLAFLPQTDRMRSSRSWAARSNSVNSKPSPDPASLSGTNRRLLMTSSVSVRSRKAPISSSHSEWRAAHSAQDAHHFPVCERIRGGEIHRSGDCGVADQPFDRSTEIEFVNPRHILPAGAHATAKSAARQSAQHGKNAVSACPKDHGRAQGDLSDARCVSCEEDPFPGLGHIDGEGVLGFRSCAGFAVLVPRFGEGVSVDGSRAGIQPDRRRLAALRDGLFQDPR
jgi:hypothetical protein